MTAKTYTLPDGRTLSTSVRLPFAVRRNGEVRSFGSIERAREAAEAGSVIFFDYSPGCGHLVEEVGR